MQKQFYLSNSNKMIGGVCGGLAEYFDIDPVIIRIIFVILAFSGGGVLAYIILWIIVPRAPFIIVTPQSASSGNDSTSETTMNQESGENNSQTFAEKNIQSRKKFDGRLFAALLLIVVGLFWMLDNVLPNLHFIKFWPVVLIILGLLILMKSKNE